MIFACGCLNIQIYCSHILENQPIPPIPTPDALPFHPSYALSLGGLKITHKHLVQLAYLQEWAFLWCCQCGQWTGCYPISKLAWEEGQRLPQMLFYLYPTLLETEFENVRKERNYSKAFKILLHPKQEPKFLPASASYQIHHFLEDLINLQEMLQKTLTLLENETLLKIEEMKKKILIEMEEKKKVLMSERDYIHSFAPQSSPVSATHRQLQKEEQKEQKEERKEIITEKAIEKKKAEQQIEMNSEDLQDSPILLNPEAYEPVQHEVEDEEQEEVMVRPTETEKQEMFNLSTSLPIAIPSAFHQHFKKSPESKEFIAPHILSAQTWKDEHPLMKQPD